MSLPAALLAILVGSALGAAAIAAAAVPGAQTGAPAMVLLRGLFGARVSAVPTVLNIVQMVGWGTFELVTIAAALGQVFPTVPNSVWVLGCGAVTTLLAVHPLGSVRVLRRYVSVAVVLALGYLFVQLLGEPAPATAVGGWSGFGRGVDTTLAVAISWVPMAADYARHSRTPRAAAGGAFLGYAVTQMACYALGVVALVTAATGGSGVFAAFLAVPLGAVAFLVLAVRELDQSFADVYSTTISTQNLRPGWDRRVISLVVGAITTLLALVVNIYDYASFLSLIGSVFVPMFAVLVVDWFGFAGARRWDLGPDARSRPAMLLPWAAGFATYQLLNPGQVPGWSSAWASLATTLGITPPAWLSASLCAFAVAAACTALVHALSRNRTGR
jgi:putative hydroxymethylpyrimidine transporter CytX